MARIEYNASDVMTHPQNDGVGLNQVSVTSLDNTKDLYYQAVLKRSKISFVLCAISAILGEVIIIVSVTICFVTANFEWLGIISGAIVEVIAATFLAISKSSEKQFSEFFSGGIKEDSKIQAAKELIGKIEDLGTRDQVISDAVKTLLQNSDITK